MKYKIGDKVIYGGKEAVIQDFDVNPECLDYRICVKGGALLWVYESDLKDKRPIFFSEENFDKYAKISKGLKVHKTKKGNALLNQNSTKSE